MALSHFSDFQLTNTPQGSDYIVGYIADPSRGGPVEYRTTVTKFISGFISGTTATIYPSNCSIGHPYWNKDGDLAVAGGFQAYGDISAGGNGSFNTVNGYAINLQHGVANDGVNPNLFIGENVSDSLSGFNTIYDEVNNKYIIASQFGTTPLVSALSITQTGNIGINTLNPNTTLTVSGNISASGSLSASGDVTVGGALNHPGAFKAWVVFDATKNASGVVDPTNTNRYLTSYYNVSCVQKTDTGLFTIVFNTPMAHSNYFVTGMNTASVGGTNMGVYSGPTAGPNGYPVNLTLSAVEIVVGSGVTKYNSPYNAVGILSM